MPTRIRLTALLVAAIAVLLGSAPAKAKPAAPEVAGTTYTDPYAGFSITQPTGWALGTSNGVITVTQDPQQLVGVMVMPVRTYANQSPQEWLGRFGDAIGGALRNGGGTFSLGKVTATAREAAAPVKGSADGAQMLGVLAVECEPGFLTMRMIFAPADRFARVSSTLTHVAKSFRRSTSVNVGGGIAQQRVGAPVQSAALSTQQGQWFRVAAPAGWRLTSETERGFDVVAPDGSAHVNYAFALSAPGTVTPQNVLGQFLPLVFKNIQVIKAEPAPLTGWNAVAVELTGYDTALGRPVRAVATAATQGYYGTTHFQLAVRAADASRWEQMKGLLAEMQGSIVNYNGNGPLTQGVLLPKNNPCDSSTIISSGLYRDQVTSSSGQRWSQAMLGTERVYSPTLGQQYTVNQNAWWGTGPQGPGYYREIPNGFEKLDIVKP